MRKLLIAIATAMSLLSVSAEETYKNNPLTRTTNNISFSVTKAGMGDVDVEVIERTETSHTYKLVATPKEGYEFLYWETYNEGILTEEQALSPELTLTITKTEYVQAFFTQSPYCGIDEGENIAWSIKNDTLYLVGEGEMENYSVFTVPPYAWSLEEFSVVKVAEGITTIGKMGFVYMDNIKKVYLPSTLKGLGDYVFTGCEALEKVYFASATPPTFGASRGLENLFAETSAELQLVVPCESVAAYKNAFAGYTEADYDTDETKVVALDIVCESGDDSVDDIDADGVVVMAEDGRISVNRDEFQIFDILGHDATSANGSLATGVYVVKVDGKAYKAVVK